MSGKGFLTAKAIGNRIKAKGLQKLRWYCQMCEKQCRDENGFKCHCLSEAHTRQMALFREDPSKFMDQYSQDFQQYFMDVMKRKGGLRVKANTVYQEVVADRTHIHMNSTKWETLGAFVQYLGKTGLCRVDQGEQGWYVQYIDRDPRVIARQEEIAKRAEQSLDEEERAARKLEKQIEEARAAEEAAREARGEGAEEKEGGDKEDTPDLAERTEEEKIQFSLAPAAHAAGAASAAAAASPATPASSSSGPSSTAASLPAASSAAVPLTKPAAPFSMSLAKPSLASAFGGAGAGGGKDGDGVEDGGAGSKRKVPSGSAHASTLSALMQENERTKQQEQAAKKLRAEAAPPAPSSSSSAAPSSSSSTRLAYWLAPNIVVKVLNKKLLNGALYKQKGVVVRVHDRYVAELRLLTGAPGAPAGTVLRIDQDELESVLPALGKLVLLVNGRYRGEIAVLLDIDEARFCGKVRIESGMLRGREVEGVEYEDMCKLHDA